MLHTISKRIAVAVVAVAAIGGTLSGVAPARAATYLSLSLWGTPGPNEGVPQWDPAGDPLLVISAPGNGTMASVRINNPPPAAPAQAPSFTTDNYGSGSPEWFMTFTQGGYLVGYPSNAGLGSANWEVFGGNCKTAVRSAYGSYADMLAALQNAGCGGDVQSAQITADGAQYPTPGDTITNIQYNGEIPVPGPDIVTVNDPGTQTASVNEPISRLLVQASSNKGDLISHYEADGLPPGLSVNSSDGAITGAPTTNGTYTVRLRAYDDGLTMGSALFRWQVGPAAAVGAEGGDGALWVQAPQLGAGWHSLGGKISAPPAVAAPAATGTALAQPMFVATASNHQLYIRSLKSGWQELGPATGSCIGQPAAVVVGTKLTVACRGLNNALWENSATVPASGLPKFTTGWASLGGTLTAGPAVTPVNGTLTFFAPSTGGRVYTRTLAAGYKATPWVCIGNPAAATSASGSATFACEGSDHALWESASTGSGWPGAHSISGYGSSIVGSPALAGTSDGTVSFVEYTDRSAWEYVSPVFGWLGLGGTITGGLGAAAVG